MNVLLVPAPKNGIKQMPRYIEIDGSLESMQKLVGGYIEEVILPDHNPFSEGLAMVCNEEGKINGLEGNIALVNENGELYDVIFGDVFICKSGEGDFESLLPLDVIMSMLCFNFGGFIDETGLFKSTTPD